MIKPIKNIINKLYYKYGDVQKPEEYEIIVDKTQLNHYSAYERYDRITYEILSDDYRFEETVKNILVDRLADAIQITKRDDNTYRYGDVIYEAEIWVRE